MREFHNQFAAHIAQMKTTIRRKALRFSALRHNYVRE
jgi:hypothetical protein